MNILITGGTGLIGSTLIPRLLTHNHTITVLTRSLESAKAQLPEGIALIKDLSQLENLDEYQAVINLAGEPIVNKRWSDSQKRKLEQSRWSITEELVTLINASESPPEVFISGSAVGFYGRQDQTPIDETFSAPYDEFSHRLCKTWEDIALRAQASSRVCILRTGIVLASNGGALNKMVLPFKFGLGGPIGSGEHYMSWIHIDDMVDGILFLLEHQKCKGVYNFTAPVPVTNKQFSYALASAINRPSVISTPPIILKLLMGEMADLLIYGQNVLPTRLTEDGFTFIYNDIDDALNSLAL
ncbi:TIGR01777 family oxidoreductase [Aliiglaciecola sp. LCG003]|uniref:TIGR01777 family oxidoreductase n=1 Tax=Aliiglaciecola sp. LCG003 TaxID=3053655 RepID=UPI002572D414|nr:TIGR01777 family oxidoreductase [Aliiglaciecola sp. LCG003]WJG11276.1 TIGR01777 family oxidoreductase [Aliiglaciecola sp. LCG003]